MKLPTYRFLSISIKIIIIYVMIMVTFLFAFFMVYRVSRDEIGQKLETVKEEYFLDKVNYIDDTFRVLKNNAYDLRNDNKMQGTTGRDQMSKFLQLNTLYKVVNHYDYLDDVFIYDRSTGYFMSIQGSMDAAVFFKTVYSGDKQNINWKNIFKEKEDSFLNVTKFPEYEQASQKDFYTRLLFVDADPLNKNSIFVGFIIDIQKVIQNEDYNPEEANNFFVIRNENSNSLKDFLISNLGYNNSQSGLKHDDGINILKIKDNTVLYYFDTGKHLIYLNVVNMKNYYKNFGNSSIKYVVIISFMLLVIFAVAFWYLTRYSKNLTYIRTVIENSFITSIVSKAPEKDFTDQVMKFIGIRSIKKIIIIMLDAKVKSQKFQEVDTKDYDKEFNRYLKRNVIRYKSFSFLKLKKMYVIDANSVKDYDDMLKTAQEFLDESSSARDQIGINLIVSHISESKDGMEKAINEVIFLYENIPVKTCNKVVCAEKSTLVDYRFMQDELKNMVINSISSGNKQAAVNLINDLIRNNIDNGVNMNNLKAIIEEINNILAVEIFEKYNDYYDDVIMVINKINNLIEEVDAEYITYFYEELFGKISDPLSYNETKGRSKLQQCFISYIEENYRNDIYLETMAEYFNLSPKYLSSKFKEITGDNFSDYLKQFRISIAKKLLRDTQKKVNEISEQLGYNNVNVFIRHFKSIEGITPKSYREIL